MVKSIFCALVVLMSLPTTLFAGTLSDNIRIESKHLGYALQYRVFVPDNLSPSQQLPSIYFTDGQWHLARGGMTDVIETQLKAQKMAPVVAIFVDNRNPDDLSENRRNQQFMCNQQYVNFFTTELIPAIEAQFPVLQNREQRVISGISFGGLNAACFGLMAYPSFANIAMQSPANSEHLKLITDLYRKNDVAPVKMFFSTGTKKDNTKAARKFYRTLKKKGYEINYIEVPFGHTWENWQPLMDDLLLTFFATNSTNEQKKE